MGQKYAITQQPHATYRIYKGDVERSMPQLRADKREPMSVLDVLMERRCGTFKNDFSGMTVTTGDAMTYDPQTKAVKFVKDSYHIRKLDKNSVRPNPRLTAFALPKDSYGKIKGLELKISDVIFLSEPNAINRIAEGKDTRGIKDGNLYEQAMSEQQRKVWEYLAEPLLIKPRTLYEFDLSSDPVRKNRGFRVVLPPLDLLFEADTPVILPITITDRSG